MTKPAIPRANRNGCIVALAVIIGLGILGTTACLIFGGSGGRHVSEQEQQDHQAFADRLKTLATTSPGNLRPDGTLKTQLRQLTDFGNTHGEIEREIKGQVVEWTLTVFDVSRHGSEYRVHTSDQDKVETVIVMDPSNHEEKSRINGLHTGNVITVRGYIRGIAEGNVEIAPALLVH